ncbi:MAG: hydroxyisourate hydrolase [Pseudomonadota bacterium]
MTQLTTHVLDTAHGCPAAGMRVWLYACKTDSTRLCLEAATNADGRCAGPLLDGAAFKAGRYRLDFAVADYFRARGVSLPDPPFLETVSIHFGIADPKSHYHVPLLVSPFGYTTYRGS